MYVEVCVEVYMEQHWQIRIYPVVVNNADSIFWILQLVTVWFDIPEKTLSRFVPSSNLGSNLGSKLETV